MEIRQVKKINLTEEVYSQLKTLLLSGEWVEGSKLPSENALSKQFSVSRVVIREALQKLRTEKLIVTRQGMGTFAANPENFLPSIAPFNLTEQVYRDFLNFRSAVEIAAVRQGVRKATEEDYRRMEACLQEMAEAEKDSERYNQADYNFHYAVVCASHNELLIRAMAANQEQIIAIFTAMNAVPNARSFAVPSHRQIMEDIRAGQVKKVITAYDDMGKYNLARLYRFFRAEKEEAFPAGDGFDNAKSAVQENC